MPFISNNRKENETANKDFVKMTFFLLAFLVSIPARLYVLFKHLRQVFFPKSEEKLRQNKVGNGEKVIRDYTWF